MTNPASNAPMLPPPSPPVYQDWVNAIIKPTEQTFAMIAAQPGAGAGKAFLWVFVASLVSGFLSSLIPNPAMRDLIQQMGQNGTDIGQAGGGIVSALCAAPIAAVFSVIFFAIGTGIVQWVAGLFGGHGSFNQLAYAFSAYTVPLSLVSGLLSLLGAVPAVGFCFGLLSILLAFYSLFLAVTATKGVNQFSWGAAAGSVLLPFAAVLALCLCLVFVFAAALGPVIGDIFSSINQSLTP